jgi:hypothetical protein
MSRRESRVVPPRARRGDDDRCTERYRKPPDTTPATADRPCRVLQKTLARAHGVDLEGGIGIRLGSVAIEQVKIDVCAWGFQLSRVSGVPDRPGLAEAQ